MCTGVSIIIRDEGKRSEDAPFTAEERREMISAALLAEDIMDANIVVVPDGGDDAAWVKRVLDAVGIDSSDVSVWNAKAEVRAAFEAAGVSTKKVVPVPGIDGGEMRRQMREGGTEWRKRIPSGAIDVIMDSLAKHRNN